MSEVKWTDEQLCAIKEDRNNVLVAAAAGSGKTAVLVERIINKIINKNIDIDKLLVVTFTNAAASEMRERILEAIYKKLDEEFENEKLQRQITLLSKASICTIDSFCLDVVKNNFYEIGISPNFRIADTAELELLKQETIEDLFEEKYEINDEKFLRLLETYSTYLSDDNLKNLVLEIYNFIQSSPFPNEWLEEKVEDFNIKDRLDTDFSENVWGKIIIKNVKEEALDCKLRLEKVLKDLSKFEELQKYALVINNDIEKVNKILNSKTWDELYNLKLEVKFETWPTDKKITLEEKNIAKDKRDKIKKKFNNAIEVVNCNSKDANLDTFEMYEILDSLKELVFEFEEKFSLNKSEKNIVDFNDIEHFALNILLKKDENGEYKPTEIAKKYMNKFSEIAIDEYQDSNLVQEYILSSISNGKNMFMVGDIKQSIYRFRNANPFIFQEKYDKYSKNDGGVKIDLNKNFRSRHETLNNINEIFNLIMDNEIGNANYIESHNMIYGNTSYDKEDTGVNNNLEIYNYKYDKDDEYTREEKELFIIANDINEKIKNKYQVFDKKSGKLRDIKFSDICIITDRNKYLSLYRKILEYKEIPSVIYMDEVLNNDMVILVIKNLINLVWNVKNNLFDNKFRYLFTSVARSFLFEYTDNDIYKILNDRKYYNDKIVEMAKKIDIEAPISEVINDILNKYMVYDKLTKLANINENIIKISNLIDISNDISNLGYSIQDFINYLDEISNLDLSVKYSINTSSGDAVKIMNIHKSKGLEFSLCYFTGMHNKFTIKEISSKNLFDENLGIIMPYISDNELNDTILKEIYKDNYLKEEISEKIRLFYVALTRCREKMIIVTSLDDDRDGYNHIVPDIDRLKYRSFLDILNSVKVIDKYVIDKDIECSHDYNKIILKDIDDNDSDLVIEKKEINIDYQKIENKHFSKNSIKLMDKEEVRKMEYGTKIHEELEYADFKNNDNTYVNNLLKLVPNNFINSYHEYEFSYIDNGIKYRGVIDLMLEYDKIIYIIDYKLKDISDKEYLNQLAGYKKYISGISKKEVKTFLYSVIGNTLKEV